MSITHNSNRTDQSERLDASNASEDASEAMDNARALLRGVPEHTDEDTIRRVHRPLSLRHNPDRGGSNAVPAHQRCRDLAEMLPAPTILVAYLRDREARMGGKRHQARTGDWRSRRGRK